MDPVSHAAFGRTLMGAFAASPRVDAAVRGCVAAAVLGALAPDLDALLMPLGWDVYLRGHEIGTHTLAGTVGCAVATATVVRLFVRRSRYRALVLFAWLGAASHLFLDLISSARVRPAWPLADTVVSVPMVAMADPWLLALCIAGPVAVWWSAKRGARAVLAASVLFLLVKGAGGLLAFSAYRAARDAASEPVSARVIEAKWASLDTWHVFDRTPERLRAWRTTARGRAVEILSWPTGPETALVRSSRTLSTVRNFLHVHYLGFPVTIRHGNGGSSVLWSDVRFCWDATSSEAPALEPVVNSELSPMRIACALWFGGEFDADGRPIREVVTIGGFTQTRAPAQ